MSSLATLLTEENTHASLSLLQKTTQQGEAAIRISTFLVHRKHKILPLPVQDIALFYITEVGIHVRTFGQEDYMMSQTLDELEAIISPVAFFRVNRQHIIHRKAVKDLEVYFNGRLLLNCSSFDKPIIISKARVGVFKNWLMMGE
ncbi:LytR/AlgR family response regulator transcription factor [Chryseosolibacter indicus]|uniref:LytTR family transcriptional regulator n=1 Tax=Chryseosolibacter indicus TaxID=2782351 RepID=A0ABS5VSL5_9BACT|nr:LytTR family DNA-binding domain-containing protein [Chryseosolibacter indicus]MBT1704425.1 LytTR family transcriptional regulator [Chryseosolibacter indicus]